MADSMSHVFEKISNFCLHLDMPYPGFEEFEVTSAHPIVKTRYESGIRYGSRVKQMQEWWDISYITTGAREYKTKKEARHALASTVLEEVLKMETDEKAMDLFRGSRKQALYSLLPHEIGFIENPSMLSETEHINDGGLAFATLKMRFLQIPFEIFARLYAKYLAKVLDRMMRIGNVSIDQGVLFKRGLTMGILEALLPRKTAEPVDPNNDPYPCFKLELQEIEMKEIAAFAEAALNFVFAWQQDLSAENRDVRKLARMLGQEAGKQLKDVEVDVAMTFNIKLRSELEKFLGQRKKREEDVEMGGME